jgi:hypothetical protein
MKKTLFVAALAAVALGGCAISAQSVRNTDQEHMRPAVTVRYGVLAVSPEPIAFNRLKDNGPITFQAPEGYTFPRNGIEFLGLVVDRNNNPVEPNPKALKDAGFDLDPEGRKAFDCRYDDKNPREIACQATSAVKKGIYRYLMRVRAADGKVIDSDPHVFSME